jgi:hypothetical protein
VLEPERRYFEENQATGRSRELRGAKHLIAAADREPTHRIGTVESQRSRQETANPATFFRNEVPFFMVMLTKSSKI